MEDGNADGPEIGLEDLLDDLTLEEKSESGSIFG